MMSLTCRVSLSLILVVAASTSAATGVTLVERLEVFVEVPGSAAARAEARLAGRPSGVAIGSDAFIPFRDEDGLAACDQYGMVMTLTGMRLFYH